MHVSFYAPVFRNFTFSIFSLSSIIITAFVISNLLLPVLLAYASGSFWLKENSFREQPTVTPTNQFLVLFQGLDSNTNSPFSLVWSSNSLYNQHFSTFSRPVTTRTKTIDLNNDRLNDLLEFEISIPLLDSEKVFAARVSFEIEYALASKFRLQMKSLINLQSSSAISSSCLNFTGDLIFNSRDSISGNADNIQYYENALNFTQIMGPNPNSFSWDNVMRDYSARNIKTTISNLEPVWRVGRANSQHFVISGRIYVPSDRIFYTPGVWEVLKHGWIQYLAYFILLFVLEYAALWFLFSSGVLNSNLSQSISTEKDPLKTFVY